MRCDLTLSADAVAAEYDCVIALASNGNPARSAIEPYNDLKMTAGASLSTFAECRARRLIYFSSGAVYEGLKGAISPSCSVAPKLPYAVAKLASERYADYFTGKNFEETVVLRFFGAYGPHEPARKIYSLLVKWLAFERRDSITLRGDGSNMIDAMYVDDAVAAIVRVAEAPFESAERGFRILDLPSGNPMTIRELAERSARAFDRDITIHYEGEIVENHHFVSSPNEFAARYDFRPSIPLEEGMRALRDWLNDRKNTQ